MWAMPRPVRSGHAIAAQPQEMETTRLLEACCLHQASYFDPTIEQR